MPTDLPKNYRTPESRKRIALYLSDELQAAITVRRSHKLRDDQIEAMYRNQAGITGLEIVDGIDKMHIPFIQPRIDRVVNQVHAAITGVNPIVQAIPDDENQQGADDLESGLETIAIRAKFGRVFRNALRLSALCGVSIIRARMTELGMKFDYIHPQDFVISPVTDTSIESCSFVGHRIYKSVQQIEQLQKLDVYYKKDIILSEGESPDSEQVGRSQIHDLTLGAVNSPNRETNVVKIWELIVKLDFGKGLNWHRVVMDESNSNVLSIEPYIYSRPWYFDLRFHDEYSKWWPAGSIGYSLQGLQQTYSMLCNLMIVGPSMSCMPPMVISGGLLSDKLKKYKLGQILESESDIKAQMLPITFQAGAMPEMINKVEELGDSAIGSSEAGISSEYAPGTTATAANEYAQSQAENENAYTEAASYCVEDIWTFMYELCIAHPAVFHEVYGSALKPGFWDALTMSAVRFEVTGKVPGNTPNAQMSKIMTLDQLSQNPMSDLKVAEIEKAAVNMLNLPVDPSQLLGRQEQQAAMAQQQAAAQGGMNDPNNIGGPPQALPQPGMGAPNGMVQPPGAGSPPAATPSGPQ